MIKSELGTVEVQGMKPVVMAEFITLLKALKNVLGDESYNRALQRVGEDKPIGKDADMLSKEDKEHIIKAIENMLGMGGK